MNTDALSGSIQDNVLVLALFSDSHAQVVRSTVEVSLFTARAYRDIVTRAYAYIDQYKRPPKQHIADELEDLVKAEGDHSKLVAETLHNAYNLWEAGFDEAYAATQLEHFVRQQSLKVGIIKAHELVQRGELDAAEVELARAAKARATSFDPGITLKDAIKALSDPNVQRDVLTVGIPEIDKRQLGPAKKELHLLIGPPKRGKSQWLVHCTKRALMQGWRGVYITLELGDKFVGRRALQSIFAVKTREDAEVKITRFIKGDNGRLEGLESVVRKRPSIATPEQVMAYAEKVDALHYNNRLRIKHFATGSLTVNGIDAYLDQLEHTQRFVPDFVVLDYADLMKLDPNNYRLALGTTYKDLRGNAFDRNYALITASQSTRGGSTARLVRDSDVAEDYSKIGTADAVFTYNQTEHERRRGLARLFVASGRVEADRFSTVIVQNYTTGQFAIDSFGEMDEYWTFVERNDGGGDDNEGDDGR